MGCCKSEVEVVENQEPPKTVAKDQSINSTKEQEELKSSQVNNSRIIKPKKKKNEKAPYIILENITDPYSMLSVMIFAYSLKDEIMLPIWVEKNKYLKFKVTGKWCIDPKYEYTDSTGMPSSGTMQFNYGGLIGRINDEEPFLVYDELTQLTKKGGPLYLKMNLPKNLNIRPQGSLNLSIFDGTYMEISEINKKIGWKESNENYENINPSDIEKEVANYINNLRLNPKLFYEKYIQNNQNLTLTEEYLKKIAKNERSELVIDDECYQSLSKYLSNSVTKDNLKNIHKNNAKTFIKKFEKNIYSFFLGNMEDNPIINCKLTKKNKPLDICIQYLLDVDFRNNIFDENSQSFAIKFLNNIYKDLHLLIFILIKKNK